MTDTSARTDKPPPHAVRAEVAEYAAAMAGTAADLDSELEAAGAEQFGEDVEAP